ncbi:unnamed protein product [Blepharisma stoltei]|uniref:PPM-type phosphatase domain-containing protein n=1 Tax=Blepharisma stoltei TaxID=1481888 RepID=A0AAU9J8E4_9CILI|nr:unnamed protein product [Blepharisma stoltei]
MGLCFARSKDEKSPSTKSINSASIDDYLPRRLSVVPMNNYSSIEEPLSNYAGISPREINSQSRYQPSQSLVKVEGKIGSRHQKGFEGKKMSIIGNSGLQIMQKAGIAVACKKGLKPNYPNQDDFAIIIDEDFYYFGVFDGHGQDGHEVSSYVKHKLPTQIMEHELFEIDLLRTITESYLKINQNLEKIGTAKNGEFDTLISGTTATSIIIRKNRLYIGHVGDSRAILGIKGENGYEALRLTIDHKPMLPEEKKRIEAKKGQVRRLDNDIPYRVFVKDQNYPGLSTSRALGDVIAQQVGVIPNPQTAEMEINVNTEYLILCSDGVWEFLSDQEALDIVASYGRNVEMAVEALATLSYEKWIENEKDISDDITVIVAIVPSLLNFEKI